MLLRALPPAMVLLAACVVFAPSASACSVADRHAPTGGVTGLTYTYAADTANTVACGGSAQTLADQTCVYLWGVDCADLPDQAIATVLWFL